jgi:hypothetical protein
MTFNVQVKRAPSLEDLTGLSADQVNQETKKCLIKSKLRQVSLIFYQKYSRFILIGRRATAFEPELVKPRYQ